MSVDRLSGINKDFAPDNSFVSFIGDATILLVSKLKFSFKGIAVAVVVVEKDVSEPLGLVPLVDLIEAETERAQKMWKRLDEWLKKTNAAFPSPDPEFDPDKRMQRWDNIRSNKREGLEKQHANFLETDYKPNKDWWGSSKD